MSRVDAKGACPDRPERNDEDAGEPERKRVAASKQPYPAFSIDVRVDSHVLSKRIFGIMKELLEQNVKGGTDCPLRLVVGFSTVPINEVVPPQLLLMKGPSSSHEGIAPMQSGSAVALTAHPNDPGSAPVGATDLFATAEDVSLAQDLALLPRYAYQTSLKARPTHQLSDLTVQIEPMVRLVFIYDNEGRVKNVVLRNLRQKGPQGETWWEDALGTLRQIPIPEILAQVLRTQACCTFESWQNNNNYGLPLHVYLKNRCPVDEMMNPQRLLTHGLDFMAPPSRASHTRKPTLGTSEQLPRSGPSTSAPDTTTENSAAQLNWPPSPEANGLRSLLRGSASLLSEDQVAAKSNELLKILSTILEENFRLKLAAEAAAARAAEDVRLVRHTVLPPMHLALHPEYNLVDAILTQARRTRGQLEIKMKDTVTKLGADQDAAAQSIRQIRDLCASLVAGARNDKEPHLQIIYYQSNALHNGEVFDVTCFTGVTLYQTLRVHGQTTVGCVESCTIRANDFVMQCQAESGDRDPKATFGKNTRDLFMRVMVYLASIHLAWAKEPNHARISNLSRCCLQATREDLNRLQELEVDPQAEIVTIILDVITDKGHVHLVRGNPDVDNDKYSTRSALDCMGEDDEIHGQPSTESCAQLATSLMANRVKDPVPHDFLARAIAPLAAKCAARTVELHVLLVGCNTIQAVPALKKVIADEHVQKQVVVMVTSEVWPSDCSIFLWDLYGAAARVGDLTSFRTGTRTKLGEYTSHFTRQRIVDESREELKITGSLADAVHCDRLSDVKLGPGGEAVMQLL